LKHARLSGFSAPLKDEKSAWRETLLRLNARRLGAEALVHYDLRLGIAHNINLLKRPLLLQIATRGSNRHIGECRLG
jgi:hypothetical protein